MKRALVPGIVVAAAVAAGVVSYRLSTDALALIVGVLLGLLVMIPVLGVLVWVLRGQMRHAMDSASPIPAPPPVIVVQAPMSPLASSPQAYSLPTATAGVQVPQPPPGPPARTWALRVFGDSTDFVE
jgi:hypothetical protein